MKKKIEAILQKPGKSSREERKKKLKEKKRKETPAAKLGKGTLTDTGKKVTLVELTGGEKSSHTTNSARSSISPRSRTEKEKTAAGSV